MVALSKKGSSDWFLAYTKPNQENKANRNLENQGFKTFLPKIALSQIKPKGKKLIMMFPRYIFIRIDSNDPRWMKINSTIGIGHLIKFGKKIMPVPDEIIQSIKEKLNEHDVYIEESSEIEYKEGEIFFIKTGQLKNQEAIFLSKKGKERVNVLIKLINSYAKADIPLSDIGKKIVNKELKF
tara:strand:+ start:590 stop:1135 length:546 start_codon:yes stop_codon:yes gene_type:complete